VSVLSGPSEDEVAKLKRSAEQNAHLLAKAQAETAQERIRANRLETENKAARKRLERNDIELRRMRSSVWWKAAKTSRRAVQLVARGEPKSTSRPSASDGSRIAVASERTAHDKVAAAALTRRISASLAQLQESPRELVDLADALQALHDLLGRREPRRSELWLLYIAVVTRYPSEQELEVLSAIVRIEGPAGAVDRLLRAISEWPSSWAARADIEFVSSPLIDVTHTAQTRLHSGIQRVVREVVPRWDRDHRLQLGVFDAKAACFRSPWEIEVARVLNWSSVFAREAGPDTPPPNKILVPWEVPVILTEFATSRRRTEGLISVGSWSSNTLSSISYDLIPYLLPEACSNSTRQAFTETFSVIRSSHRVSAISQSVADDLVSIARTFSSVGIAEPAVRAHPLPTEHLNIEQIDTGRDSNEIGGVPGVPLVVSVGNLEPRKNQLRTLLAAEALWREGIAFELVFIGWSGWVKYPLAEEVDRLRARGRPVRIISQASDRLVAVAYSTARFTVFVSRAEGYGLPIAESIAYGTPVLTSDFGAMAEVGTVGGALLVNPLNENAVTDGMRRLLTDDDLILRLRQEAEGTSLPKWDEHAAATWDWLTNATADSTDPSAGTR
jgi:glycosyltransferase involved in cell wall biosynthesis